MTDFAAMERYAQLKVRAERLVEAMHHNLAGQCDLDGLEAVVDAFERVALKGDRIEVTSAQKLAAERRRLAEGQQVSGPPVALNIDLPEPAAVASGSGLTPADAAEVRAAVSAAVDVVATELGIPEEGEPGGATGQVGGDGQLVITGEFLMADTGPVTPGPIMPASLPAISQYDPALAAKDPDPVLVVKQAPPAAKPGRGRGFRLKGDA